jgi:DNA-binding SARP family transcriptional activator
MLRLVTLGCLAVERDRKVLSGPPRRLLALLALAAAGGVRGVSREQVLAYLWPESNTSRARNCLRQSVFALRQDLGKDVLEPVAANLRINPAVMTTDLWDFENARALDAHQSAVCLYAGAFLDGFHLPYLPGFQEWVERQRARLALSCSASVEALAQRATREGDWSGAIKWYRMLNVLDPLSSRVALALMRVLVASGDRTGALEFARTYNATVRKELEAPPDPAVTGYANWLRSGALGRSERRRYPRTRTTPAH